MQKNEFIMKPKVDFCFKELMTDDEVRRGFIAAVLGLSPEKIKNTVLLPTLLQKEHAEDKLGILDVRVLLEENVQIDIEMQVMAFTYWILIFSGAGSFTPDSISGRIPGGSCIPTSWRYTSWNFQSSASMIIPKLPF